MLRIVRYCLDILLCLDLDSESSQNISQRADRQSDRAVVIAFNALDKDPAAPLNTV